jgi:tRNA 2-thiouridine synthesizing protein E
MPVRTYRGVNVEVDEDGFLVTRDAWTPDIGEAMAREAGATIGPAHWRVINVAREEHAARGRAPSLAQIAVGAGMSVAAIRALFPDDAATLVPRLAGIPRRFVRPTAHAGGTR